MVVIESDVWAGCGACIMSGVSIGQRSVIAAGVPAKLVKEIPYDK